LHDVDLSIDLAVALATLFAAGVRLRIDGETLPDARPATRDELEAAIARGNVHWNDSDFEAMPSLDSKLVSVAEVGVFLVGLARQPKDVVRAIAGDALDLASHDLGLHHGDGLGVHGLAKPWRLERRAAGWAIVPRLDRLDLEEQLAVASRAEPILQSALAAIDARLEQDTARPPELLAARERAYVRLKADLQRLRAALADAPAWDAWLPPPPPELLRANPPPRPAPPPAPPPRAEPRRLLPLRETAIGWQRGTGDARYVALARGVAIAVKIAAAPDAPFYSLLVDGRELERFDDWPESWRRPSSHATQRPRPALVDLRHIVGALSPASRDALATAIARTSEGRQREVTSAHFLLALIEFEKTELGAILSRCAAGPTRALVATLRRWIAERPSDHASRPVFDVGLLSWIQDAWMPEGAPRLTAVRSSVLLATLAPAADRYLPPILLSQAAFLAEVPADRLVVAARDGDAES
jgi:hypothetical protein